MRSISFLLPKSGNIPSGGYRVVFEYANRLAADGFVVHIIYPTNLFFRKMSISKKLKGLLRFIYWRLAKFSARNWFDLDKRIKEHIVISLNQNFVPRTDFYVATAIQTSFYLKDYDIESKHKFYLIQDFENWEYTDEEVISTYKFGLRNLVVSDWLAKIVIQSGVSCEIIKNGFDFNYFKLYKPIALRDKYTISMLFHNQERKGCYYGLEALKIVKRKYPDLKVMLFGTPCRPVDLPYWIKYYQMPDKTTHNMIYNESAIYLAPSLQEGWGLTVGEAMICGAAIVCTNTLGFQEMVNNEESGLIAPIKNAQALADKLIELIENDEKRISLASHGNEIIKEFDWNRSYKKFKSLFS